MTQSRIPKELLFKDAPCPRCQKMMAFDRLYYAVNEVASVGYKCLSCGYEETQPRTPPELPE
jgi:Zn ribbon nucleic-acid-binding protein